MFAHFILALRQAGVPASITEYLALMAAMKANVAEYSVEDFYYLSRAALVKDERHLDRFDRVFGECFKGLEPPEGDLRKEIPEEWLRKMAEKLLSPEEMKQIQAMGGLDALLDRLRELLREQKGRHQGGSKWIGTAGTSPFGAYGYNPEGVRIGQDESRHRSAVKVNVMEEAAAQESVRQLLLVVRGDDHDRPMRRHHRLASLVDEKLHPIELQQQVIGKLDICLVHLVDQDHHRLGCIERVPQLAAYDVVRDVVHPLIAELPVAQPRHRIILIEPLLRLRRRLDVPLDQRMTQSLRHLVGQHGLAGTRLALYQQRPLQRHRRIDRHLQIAGGNVTFRTLKSGHRRRSMLVRHGLCCDYALTARVYGPPCQV